MRSWRKWLVRGLVFAILGLVAGAGWLYQHLTHPAAVRQQVLAKLGQRFVGATVSLDSAHMQLLGGIAVRELRLARRDDMDNRDFAYVPSAVIYHDKERLLDGKLDARRIELHNLRLRVVRTADGHWNLENILGPFSLEEQQPTIVVQQGTILVEDRRAPPGAPPIELKNVNLVLVNDPLPTWQFHGTGQSETAGTFEIKGTFGRASGEAALTITAGDVPVGPALVQRLASYCPDLAEHARRLAGVGRLQAELSYRPGESPELSYQVTCQIAQGSFQHPRLPWPLQQLEALVRAANGQVGLVRATAHAGPARLELTVKDLVPCGCGTLEQLLRELELKVEQMPVTAELFACLPGKVPEIRDDFQPAGFADLTYTFRRLPGGDWEKRCTIRPIEGRACFIEFPYPVTDVTGLIDFRCTRNTEDLITVDLTGKASNRPVHVQGELRGESPNRAITIDVWGHDLPIDDKLERALPREYQRLAREFHPTGRLDFKAQVRRNGQGMRPDNCYRVQFHHAGMKHDIFPYPVEELAGTLEIRPDHFEFYDFRGTHKGAEFRAAGRSYPEKPEDRVRFTLQGSNVLLDPELHEALRPHPHLFATWQTFKPAGRIDFESNVEFLAGQDRDPDIELTALARGCSMQPTFFRYQLDDLTGQVHYAHNQVDLRQLRARHGDSLLGLEKGTVNLKPGGGFYARLEEMTGNPLVPDAELLRALPQVLRTGCTSLCLKDAVTLKTLLIIDAPPEPEAVPVIYWDGNLGLRDATVYTGVKIEHVTGQVACRGIYNPRPPEPDATGRRRFIVGNIFLRHASLFGQPLEDIHTQLEVFEDEPTVLRFPGVQARLYGGELYGPIRVDLGSPLRYELNLTASQMKMEEFGRINLGPGADVNGQAVARLYLAGQGAGLEGLKGSGSLEVPAGKMYNLPPLLDLLKFLGLRLPDRTAFEEAQASYDIDGRRLRVRKLNLYGNSVSLRGLGEIDLETQEIDLDFNVDWARLNQMLGPGLKKLPEGLSNQLLRINMRGKLGALRFHGEPVPILVDPLRRMWPGPNDRAAVPGDKP